MNTVSVVSVQVLHVDCQKTRGEGWGGGGEWGCLAIFTRLCVCNYVYPYASEEVQER